MKNNINLRIHSYTLLAMSSSLFFSTGCKKDDEENNGKGTNSINSNIEFFDIDDIYVEASSNTNNEDIIEFDINKDGVNDFSLNSYNYFDANEYLTSIHGLNVENGIGSEVVNIGGSGLNFVKSISDEEDVKNLNFNHYVYTGTQYAGYYTEGIIGKGDKLIGVKFIIKNQTHYGWLKINADNNALKLTLKEMAYNKIAGETIKAGQK